MSNSLHTINLIQNRLIKKDMHQSTTVNTSTSIQALSPESHHKCKHIDDVNEDSIRTFSYQSHQPFQGNPYKTSSVKVPCKVKRMVEEMITVKRAYDQLSKSTRPKLILHRSQSSYSKNTSANLNQNELNYIFTNRFENPLKSARVKPNIICLKCQKKGHIHSQDKYKPILRKKPNEEIQQYINNRLFSPSPYKKKYIISKSNPHSRASSTRKCSLQLEQPQLFEGPIDIQMIFPSQNARNILEVVLNVLKKCRIVYSKINLYKYHCSKNGDSFNLEIFSIQSDSTKKLFYISIKSKNGSVKHNQKLLIKMLMENTIEYNK